MKVVVPELSESQQAEMLRLLADNTEMLHRAERQARCPFCGKYRAGMRFDEECPALLRHALNLALEAAAHFAYCRQCGEVSVSTCDEGGRDYAIKLGLYKPEA